MSSHSADAWIDDELRNVVCPADLLPKLNAIASLDDAELDRALCDVATPAGLLDRLRSIGSLDEVDVDDELRHVVVPISLAERLRRIPAAMQTFQHKKAWIHRLAIAASLLVAAGIGYVAAISPTFFGNLQRPSAPRNVATNAPGVGRAVSSGNPQGADSNVSTGDPAADLAKAGPRDETENDHVATQPPSVNPGVSSTADSQDARPDSQGLPDSRGLADGTVADRAVADVVYGAGTGGIDRLPPLESMPLPVWRGVSPPRELGYDFMFQLRYGVHPFVLPSASLALEVCQVPLVTSTASFDLALQLAAERRLPASDKIRTEEFLAAMDYDFPPPEGKSIGIRTAIAPSPWSTSGSTLLQVAAQAKTVTRGDQGPSHVVVILDASASMRWENRWNNTMLGLRNYVERMGSADRFSLVLMAGTAEVIAERQLSADALQSLESLPAEPLAKSVRLADALTAATDIAGRGLSVAPARIVLLTDGLLGLDEPTNESVETLLQRAGGDGYRFEVFDVRPEETIDAELNQLAAAAGTTGPSSRVVTHVTAASDLRWNLLEVATGRSQFVANKATMKVTFKPDTVAMYRLMGHEPTSIAVPLIGATVEADLRSGEAATGMFELALKPDGGDTIATIEVTWRDPKTGAEQSTKQTVSRLQLASSFHQAPLSLQLGALAAETAAVLRNSYFAPPNSHSLAGVAQLADQLNPRLRSRPSFAKLMTLVEQAQRSRVVPQ